MPMKYYMHTVKLLALTSNKGTFVVALVIFFIGQLLTDIISCMKAVCVLARSFLDSIMNTLCNRHENLCSIIFLVL